MIPECVKWWRNTGSWPRWKRKSKRPIKTTVCSKPDGGSSCFFIPTTHVSPLFTEHLIQAVWRISFTLSTQSSRVYIFTEETSTAGEENVCFKKESQVLSYAGLNRGEQTCCPPLTTAASTRQTQDRVERFISSSSSVLPWAAYPSGGRRRLREGSVASEAFSAHTGPSGWSWRELELTRCRL